MMAKTVDENANEKPPLSSSVIPEWLNGQFLEENLQIHHKNAEIKVIDFEVKPTAGKGENFASSLYRVKVTYSIPSNAENSVSSIDSKVDCSY